MKESLGQKLRRASSRLGVLAMAGALLWVIATAASFESACIEEPNPSAFDGGALGYCSGYTAMRITAGACSGCSGEAYALCNGDRFTECACDLPSIYSLDAGTFEAAVNYIEEGGLTALSEDAGEQLPCCEGDTVFEIPAVNCPSHCKGPIGYAVCHDNAYTECACSIPPGFVLSTITCDGG
jgi:hypothetical protein